MSKSESKLLSGTHFMLGNHAIVEGALAADCNFFAGYPITPANEISQYMSQRMPKTGGVFFQGEDELCGTALPCRHRQGWAGVRVVSNRNRAVRCNLDNTTRRAATRQKTHVAERLVNGHVRGVEYSPNIP